MGLTDGEPMAFSEMLDELEMAIETAERFEHFGDNDATGRIPLIFERLAGVTNAIDDWRQG